MENYLEGSKPNYPVAGQICNQILNVLAELGGTHTGRLETLYHMIERGFPGLTAEDLNRTKIRSDTNQPESVWQKRVRGAKQRLVDLGQLESPEKVGQGTWQLTQSGWEALRRNGQVSSLSAKQQEDIACAIAPIEATGIGFATTGAQRKAIEKQAVKTVVKHYEDNGFEAEEYGQPFDLLLRKGELELYAEIKGTRASAAQLKSIVLTPGEVKFARQNASAMMLLIVTDINLQDGPGGPIASGGTMQRPIYPWQPEDTRLEPISFLYRLA